MHSVYAQIIVNKSSILDLSILSLWRMKEQSVATIRETTVKELFHT